MRLVQFLCSAWEERDGLMSVTISMRAQKTFNLSFPICAIFTRVVVNAKTAITTQNVSQCTSSNDGIFCQNVRISFSVKLSARSVRFLSEYDQEIFEASMISWSYKHFPSCLRGKEDSRKYAGTGTIIVSPKKVRGEGIGFSPK